MSWTTYSIVFIGLALSLLPLWVGSRRKIGRLPMLAIMLVSGAIPIVGLLGGLYIAFRAAPNQWGRDKPSSRDNP